MKKIMLMAMLLATSSVALAAPRIVTISQFDVGKAQWPFTREEVMLSCRSPHAMYVINPSTLMEYPVNDAARAQVRASGTRTQPITVILADDPDHPGQKKSLAPILAHLEALCSD